MPGRGIESCLQHSYGSASHPLSAFVLAGLPVILVPGQVAGEIALRCYYQGGGPGTTVLLSREEEREFVQYGFRSRFPIFISGDTVNRAGNIVWMNCLGLQLGDVPFALFMRLAAELYKNMGGMIPKSRLINAGYIRADGEYQSVSRLREIFRPALNGLDPQDFIETCQPRYLRLSTHPAFISYDRPKLLSHRNVRIRRLAKQLP